MYYSASKSDAEIIYYSTKAYLMLTNLLYNFQDWPFHKHFVIISLFIHLSRSLCLKWYRYSQARVV